MKTALALVSAAVAAAMLATTPAVAKARKHHHGQANYYERHFGVGSDKYLYDGRVAGRWGFTTRNVSDPSYNSGARFRANPYRCTEDLGYGRYEYCGW